MGYAFLLNCAFSRERGFVNYVNIIVIAMRFLAISAVQTLFFTCLALTLSPHNGHAVYAARSRYYWIIIVAYIYHYVAFVLLLLLRNILHTYIHTRLTRTLNQSEQSSGANVCFGRAIRLFRIKVRRCLRADSVRASAVCRSHIVSRYYYTRYSRPRSLAQCLFTFLCRAVHIVQIGYKPAVHARYCV